MRIAVIADDGEVIDTADVDRKEFARALDPEFPQRHQYRTWLMEQLDTVPVRRYIGLAVPGSRDG